jgi:hypothetical protein
MVSSFLFLSCFIEFNGTFEIWIGAAVEYASWGWSENAIFFFLSLSPYLLFSLIICGFYWLVRKECEEEEL